MRRDLRAQVQEIKALVQAAKGPAFTSFIGPPARGARRHSELRPPTDPHRRRPTDVADFFFFFVADSGSGRPMAREPLSYGVCFASTPIATALKQPFRGPSQAKDIRRNK